MPKVDLTNQQFGNLKIISWDKDKQKWTCSCACNRQTYVTTTQLTRKDGKNTQACKMCRGDKSRQRAIARTGYNGSVNKLIYIYRTGAKTRGLEFSLSVDFFVELIQKPCNYCGRLPNQQITNGKYNFEMLYNGLDRLDNAVGYIADNVVSCCKICNFAKRSMSYEEFMSWIYDITMFNKDKIL